MKPRLTIPRFIKPGDTIGILPPSSPCKPERLAAGIAYLHAKGFKTKIALDPCAAAGQPSGLFSPASANARAMALHQLFADPEVTAIIASRGGYGAMELLPHLDFDLVRSNPKWFVGFSDITVLLVALHQLSGLVTLHGPMVASSSFAAADSNEQVQRSAESLLGVLSGAIANPFADVSMECIAHCSPVSGKFVGGNLTLLTTLIGTPWEPDFDGCILFLEEVREELYRVHRSLLHLRLAGKIQNIRGVVVGSCETPDGASDSEILQPQLNQLLLDIFGEYGCPIVVGAPFGHAQLNTPIPIGVRGSLQPTDGKMALEMKISAKVQR